ncbi:MAG: OsmC family protein [Actinomycetes bacterium]
MAEDTRRSVTLDRLSTGVYQATNARGATLRFGSNAGDGFTPVELLLAAIGGCTAVDVDVVTARRADAEQFGVVVDAEAVRDENGNVLRDIQVRFQLRFATGADGDLARAMVPRAVVVSHDRTCTVSRTIEAGTPVRIVVDE